MLIRIYDRNRNEPICFRTDSVLLLLLCFSYQVSFMAISENFKNLSFFLLSFCKLFQNFLVIVANFQFVQKFQFQLYLSKYFICMCERIFAILMLGTILKKFKSIYYVFLLYYFNNTLEKHSKEKLRTKSHKNFLKIAVLFFNW